MDKNNIIRALLIWFLGFIGGIIINKTGLKPEGSKARVGALIGLDILTCTIYSRVVAICSLFFNPEKEKNIGYKKED